MPKLGMNLRVTSDSKQGGRKYMEDVVCVEFHKSDDGETTEFVYFAVFDGHGGKEAACFAKEHLLKEITKHRGFWSDDDRQVLKAITDGFISTHKLMWKDVGLWPKRLSGQPSTAGTTASVVFLRNGKMYIGHVGDSGIVLGLQQADSDQPRAHCVTVYHKPNSPEERKRIEENGGQVLPKAGVHRVVWNRPTTPHTGPIRRSTPIDAIPFLAVARSLGDLWSYNSNKDVFIVSPEPDVCVYDLDPAKHKFIILASDGLWDMVKPDEAADIAHQLSTCVEGRNAQGNKTAAFLVRMSLERWTSRHLRADNTSVIVAYFDQPGTSCESLTREGSTVSNASTVPTSDVVCNLTDRFDDAELDPSFYDDIYASPPMHNNDGRHGKRKHGKKGTAPSPREIGVSRPWPLAKSDRYRHKKLQGSARTGHKVQPFVMKKKKHCVHGIPLCSSNGSPYKVLIGRSDAFVPAADVTVEPCVERDEHIASDEDPDSDSDVTVDMDITVEPFDYDEHLDRDRGRVVIAQPRSISAKSPYKTVGTASGYGSRGVRQVASNITNSSHCLHEPSVESEAAETKHEQATRGKSPETSAEEETTAALVSPMWPRSMGAAVSEKPLNRCRKGKRLRKAGRNENEGEGVNREHSSPGGCRPLKRRRTDSVKSRLSNTVIHRTRLHAKTMLRSS